MTTATLVRTCSCPKPGTDNEWDCWALQEPGRVYHAENRCACCCHWDADAWEERARWEPLPKTADGARDPA